MTARLRPELAGLPVYVPGKTVPGAIKLASNETVFGPLPGVREAIERATDAVNRYPDSGCMELKAALAKHLGSDFAPEHVAVGCGSVSLCQQLVQITASVGDEVIFGWRSFELYPPQVQVAGATAIQVPLTNHTFDLDAMLASVTGRTRLIFVCNPNNPTGSLTSRADLEYAVANAPKGAILLIDEAYIHLSDAAPALDFVKQGKDVIVLRTFSKLYGMAGIRMGFAVARPDLLRRIGSLGGISALPITAVAAAKASLLDPGLVPTRKKIIGDTRRETLSWLSGQGYATTPSESNCFMLDVRRPGKEVMAAMAAKEIYIGRIWPAWPTQVRITVGTPDEMLAFRKAFSEVMSGSTAGMTPPPLPRKLAERPFTHLS